MRDASAHGFEQRVHIGADVRIDEKTGIAVDGSLSGRADTDTVYSTEGNRGLDRARLEALELARDAGAWHLSLGRFTEPIGVTGYYYNKEYDGARAVWTGADERTQVRLGYGDFHRNTGIRDSAYTHATREVFYRAPTKAEWLGYNRDILPEGYESLYDRLKKAQSTEEERQIIYAYLDVLREADPKGYEAIEKELKALTSTRRSGINNTFAWEKVTAYNRDTHETQVFYRRIADRWSDDVFRDDWDDDTKKWSDLDWLDSAKMQQKAEEMWDGAVVGSIETDRAAQTNTAVRDDSSGLLPGGHYDFTYQFMGYADYKGNHNLGDLGDGNHPSDFGDTLRGSSVDWNADFEHLTREEARRRATAGNWDKHYTEKTAQIYKDMSWGSYLATKSMNDWWKPEGGSNLPLQSLFGKLGGIVRVEGTVLKRDRTPALRRAAYVQVKRAISPAVGVQAFYLRSVHDRTHEMMFANGDHNDIYGSAD